MLDMESIKTAARHDWDRDAALRQEFTSQDAYMAFRVAEARGQSLVFQGSQARVQVPRAPGAPVTFGPDPAEGDLIQRQALVRQQNIGRQFAGLQPLPIPQQ